MLWLFSAENSQNRTRDLANFQIFRHFELFVSNASLKLYQERILLHHKKLSLNKKFDRVDDQFQLNASGFEGLYRVIYDLIYDGSFKLKSIS